MILLFIIILSVIFRFYNLGGLPAEMWGDVAEHYKLADTMRYGHYFFNYRFGGDGPLFSYLVALTSTFLGLSFYSIKVVSVIVGVLLVPAVFYLSEAFFKNKKISLIASFLTAVSFWSVSFSRQAKPHILVPLLVALGLLFALKKRRALTAAILGLGMFTQAGFWGFPLSFIGSLKIVFIPLLAGLFIFTGTRGEFNTGGFFGEKLGVTAAILTNVLRNILSFTVRGDSSFRHTIPNQPHLDLLSGFFFITGIVLFLKSVIQQRDKKLLYYFFIPFIAIQIPSLLDVNNPASTPNMGRMIGLIPLVYLATARGIVAISQMVKNRFTRNFLIAFLLFGILVINAYRYFVVYPTTLPDRNIPFGKIIAGEIDRLPSDIKVIVVGCCWGQWGQPEPDAIRFQLARQRDIYFYAADGNVKRFSCQNLGKDFKAKKIALILDPRNAKIIQQAKSCLVTPDEKLVKKAGTEIAVFIRSSF